MIDGWCYNVTNVSSFVHPLVVWKLKFSLDRGDPRIKGTERNPTKHQQRYQTKVNSKLDFFWTPKKMVAVSGLPEYCFDCESFARRTFTTPKIRTFPTPKKKHLPGGQLPPAIFFSFFGTFFWLFGLTAHGGHQGWEGGGA